MQAMWAARLLDKMSYKPGTIVSAHAVSDTQVSMSASFDSWNSTPTPYGTHDRARFGTPPIYLDVSGLNELEVVGVGLLALKEVEDHEIREFWRVAHGVAPFHPHNQSGERAWKHIQGLRNRVTVRYPQPTGA